MTHQPSSPATEVLDFLNSIEGAGYGGMASFEIARAHVQDMAAQSCSAEMERPPCPRCSFPYEPGAAERYWEARWRDEKAENDRLRSAARASRDAVIEECARVVEPKGPRPCDCERCYCGNHGDMEAVAAWDADAYNAKAIRALALPSTGRNINDVISELPQERQEKIAARAAALSSTDGK